jgi:hypothetical protein
VRPEGLIQCNIPVTPSGIEPATFRLVAQLVEDRPPESLYLEVIWALPMVSRRAARVRSQARPYGTTGGKSSNGTGLSLRYPVFHYQYHFTNVPCSYSFIYHWRFLIVGYDGSFSKWCIDRGQKNMWLETNIQRLLWKPPSNSVIVWGIYSFKFCSCNSVQRLQFDLSVILSCRVSMSRVFH